MQLTPWRRRESSWPFSADFQDALSRVWGRGGELAAQVPEIFRSAPFPPVNVAEDETRFTVTMDAPGLEEGDFRVEAMGGTLVISGERKWEHEEKGKEFRRVESQYGRFERSVALPESARLDADRIQATYEGGVLTVVVPKAEKTPVSRIVVQPG